MIHIPHILPQGGDDLLGERPVLCAGDPFQVGFEVGGDAQRILYRFIIHGQSIAALFFICNVIFFIDSERQWRYICIQEGRTKRGTGGWDGKANQVHM